MVKAKKLRKNHSSLKRFIWIGLKMGGADMKKKWLDFVTLLSSVSTLFCCALPALFVTLGLGASFAGLLTEVPQLIWLSENKASVFGFSTIMLSFAGFMQFQARNAPCPIDPDLAQACDSQRKWSFWVFLVSVGLYAIGGFFAFVLPHLLDGAH